MTRESASGVPSAHAQACVRHLERLAGESEPEPPDSQGMRLSPVRLATAPVRLITAPVRFLLRAFVLCTALAALLPACQGII